MERDHQTLENAAEATRYIFIERAHCPACGSIDLQTLRSQQQGDGVIQRRTLCRTCGHKFFVILE